MGIKRSLLAALAAVALIFAAPTASAVAAPAAQTAAAAARMVPADVDDFAFRSMDVVYTLSRDADGASRLHVVETLVALFPESDQNRGIRRFIPERYNNMPLRPMLESVTDEHGNPRPVEEDSEDDFLVVTSRADDYLHGAQTYVFTYTMQNVTWSFGDTDADEFYWDVNGTGWAQPFGRVTAEVRVDADLAAALTGNQACYQGVEGDTTRCDIRVQTDADGSARVQAQADSLEPWQTVTIAVGFARGTFAAFDNSFFASPFGWLQGVAGLGVLGVGGAALALRRRTLMDAPGRGTIIPQYTPPPGIDALLSAALLGKTTKAVPAEVLEQAIVGSIRIIETGRTWTGKPKLQAQLLDPSRADGDGIMLLQGLFGSGAAPGETFEFGGTSSRFASAASSIQSWAGKELIARGLRKKVAAGNRVWPILLGALAVAATFAFGIFAIDAGVAPMVPVLLIVAAVAVFVVVVLGVAHQPVTAAGAETKEHLLGLQMFIAWAEADRIRMLQSPQGAERAPIDANDPRQVLRLYESLLPYAVVFGQEKQWAAQLAVMYRDTTPYWYFGTGAFDASAFSSSIGSLSATAAASSSSGGSGGGGSAGGGGGGGGGGGV